MNRTIFWIRATEGLHVAVILGIWVTVGYAVSCISAKQDFILSLLAFAFPLTALHCFGIYLLEELLWYKRTGGFK